MNRSVIVVFCVVVAITALLFVGKRGSRTPDAANANTNAQAAPAPSAAGLAKGAMAPGFILKSIPGGKTIQLSSLKGKAVLVNFWATYCEPCKTEMPWLVDLQKKYGPQGLQILGVAIEDTDEKSIADFARKMGINYPVMKGTEKVGDLYGGVDGLPMSFYVDRSGKVVDRVLGLVSESIMEDDIKQALQQGSQEAPKTNTAQGR